jgi:hypothetical protein
MLLLLLLAACDVAIGTAVPTCTLDAPIAEPTEAAPGDTVTVRTRPLTESYDTVVTLGAVRASDVAVTRAECDACDTCRADNGCSACGTCTVCDEDCASCDETLTFTVPVVAAGTHALRVTNAHGASASAQLVVVGADSGEDSGR